MGAVSEGVATGGDTGRAVNIAVIEALLIARGWTWARLAEETGDSPSTYSRWRQGEGDGSRNPDAVERAGKALGVSYEAVTMPADLAERAPNGSANDPEWIKARTKAYLLAMRPKIPADIRQFIFRKINE